MFRHDSYDDLGMQFGKMNCTSLNFHGEKTRSTTNHSTRILSSRKTVIHYHLQSSKRGRILMLNIIHDGVWLLSTVELRVLPPCG